MISKENIGYLLDLGADVNIEIDGITALDLAAKNPLFSNTEIYTRLKAMSKRKTPR